jgi:AcrR family transcriptional regulator
MTRVSEKKRLPRSEREQQMLDAAIVIFARRGYHDASMDEIAERAGISKPMLYMYLGSKADLFRSCMRRESTRFVAAVAAALDPELSVEEQAYQSLKAFFSFVAEYRDAWNVLYRQARGQGGPVADEMASIRERVLGEIVSLLDHGLEAQGSNHLDRTELTPLATALVGAAEALSEWILDHPEKTPEQTTVRLMSLLWNGLGATLGGDVWQHDPAQCCSALADPVLADPVLADPGVSRAPVSAARPPGGQAGSVPAARR